MGVGRWDRAGAEHGGATALQREGERGDAISRATFQALGLGQGPGRGHSEGWPYHGQDDPGLAAQGGHCPWARLKRACWESDTRLLPSRLRFSPAACTAPRSAGWCQGLGPKVLKPHIFPQIGSIHEERLLACSQALPSCSSPSLPFPSPWPLLPSQLLLIAGRKMHWRGRLRVGRATAVGSPGGGAIDISEWTEGLDPGLHRQAWLGKRQLPGTHQHRPFWGVSGVCRAHLTPTPRPHAAPRDPVALQKPTRGKASGGV